MASATEASDLPRRPRPHELEDISRQAFEGVLPAHWQYRIEHPDYGIDGVVEIFDEEGFTTGLKFNVQLKSTDSDGPSQWRISVKRSTFNYWQQLAEPVLVVRHSASTNELRCCWASWQRARIGERRCGLSFEEEDRWGDAVGPDSIQRHVRAVRQLNLPTPAVLKVLVDVESPSASRLEMEAGIARSAEKLGLIVRVVDDREESICQIVVSADLVIADGGFGSVAMSYERVADDQFDHWCEAIVLTMAASLAECGRDETLLSVIAKATGRDSVAKFVSSHTELVIRVLSRRGRIDLAPRLVEALCELDFRVVALKLLLEFSRSVDPATDRTVLLDSLDRVAHEMGDDHELAAAAFYEVGEITFKRQPLRALEAFDEAAERWPEFHGMAAFHQRVGAAHHFAGAHGEACASYTAAQRIEFDEQRDFLIADSLLLGGEFEAARQHFRRIHDDLPFETGRYAEVSLRLTVLNDLPNDGRDIDAAEAVADRPWNVQSCQEVLTADPLCAPAAFNLALHRRATGATESSFSLFLRAAVVYEDDAEAWLNALIEATAANMWNLLQPIVDSALFRCGHDLASSVRELVPDPEQARLLLRLIDAAR